MELTFATLDLEATAQSENRLRKIFGPSCDRACQRLYELFALDNLHLATLLPPLDLRSHSKSGQFSISVCPKHRITFELVPNAGLSVGVGALDLASVTAIRILALGGRHD